MKKIVVYPGSFDPISLGHVSLIEKGIRIFDKIIVAVAHNTAKNIYFSTEKRFYMIEEVLKSNSLFMDKVEVIKFEGLLSDFMFSNNYKFLLRGLRAVSDFEYEFKMNWFINKINPEIQTIFIPADDSTQFVSSTMIRELIRLKGDVSKFVPKEIIKFIYGD